MSSQPGSVLGHVHANVKQNKPKKKSQTIERHVNLFKWAWKVFVTGASLKNWVQHQVKVVSPLTHPVVYPLGVKNFKCRRKTMHFHVYLHLYRSALISPSSMSSGNCRPQASRSLSLLVPVLNADGLHAVLLVPLSLLNQSSFNHGATPTHHDLLALRIHRHPLQPIALKR